MMKIGEFSARFNTSESRVRYYISLGLIIPQKQNSQYAFSAQCMEDMEFIRGLTALQFSLSDIHKIISIRRFFGQYGGETKSYRTLLENKLAEMTKNYDEIKKNIKVLKNMISELELQKQVRMKTGVPISFIPMLYCPICGKKLNLRNADIYESYVMNADMYCPCGYHAGICNGVVIGTNCATANDLSWDNFELFAEALTPEYVTKIEKAHQWLFGRMEAGDMDGKVVLDTNIWAGLFFGKHLEILKDLRYIVGSHSVNKLYQIKNYFDSFQQQFDILYIADSAYQFPICKSSVDIYIDNLASYNYLLLNNAYITEVIDPYLSGSARIFGMFFSHESSSRTMRKMLEIYPVVSDKSILQIENLAANLQDKGFELTLNPNPDTTTSPDIFFEYQTQGDRLTFNTFEAVRSNRD
jgi:Predicted transcriptional regulators